MTEMHIADFLRPAAAVTTAAVFLFNAAPVVATDYIHVCPDFAKYPETATVIIHPRTVGLPASASDADVFTNDFEIKLIYSVVVREFEDARPSGTDPTFCEFSGSIARQIGFPDARTGYTKLGLSDIIILKNIPRYSVVQASITGYEEDDLVDDKLDFSYDPDELRARIDVFVNSMRARSLKGGREGRDDITLNSVKRLVGDGNPDNGVGDLYASYLEFVVNVHPDPGWMQTGVIDKVADPIPAVPPLNPAPGVTPNDNPVCRDYALKSVEQNQQQLALGCGFQPPVWSNDHQMHFDWCVQGNNAQTVAANIGSRDAELAACKQAKSQPAPNTQQMCQTYAANAVAAATQAAAKACPGLTGPRWSADTNAHFSWCMLVGDPNVMQAETIRRTAELKACTGN